MGMTKELNGCPLFRGPLTIWKAHSFPAPRGQVTAEAGCPWRPGRIESGPRIGIRKAADLPLRFCLKDNPFVSRPPR
jgi:3-methyladenine DNA glycosylase Mpg